MGLFDSLFRRSRAAATPEEVRARLFDAVAADDAPALARLCAAHEALVLASFPTWKRVPEAFRTPDKLAWYGPGLIAVAQHFAEQRGRPELLESMIGAPEDNPLLQWQRTLVEVNPLMTQRRYAEAMTRLEAALEAARGLNGTGADSYLPVTCGRLGECLFQSGDAEAARTPTEQALALCVSSGDDDGIIAYLGNLYELHRYRGDASAAASCLDRLATALERLDRKAEAASHRRQATIVRAGEPLCRVVAELDGQIMEIADMSRPRGRIRFVFKRNRIALHRCSDAVEAGVQAAQRGELEAAVEWFARAAEADAFDPWPSYHAGLALLELRRYGDAAASYATTEALAPGWYHCRSDRWFAERLAAGAIDHETFSTARQLLDGRQSPAQAAAVATQALQRGELGLLRLLLGDALSELGRPAEAMEAYRHGVAIAEEPDVRTRLLVALARCATDRAEKTRRLLEGIELAGNLTAAAMATLMLASNPAAN
jgi:tetratricopeptide (TPR) repeat protein